MENVLSDENIEGREITSIMIILKESEEKLIWRDPICKVQFSTIQIYSYDEPIEYKIDDNDKAWAYSLGEELDLYVKRTLKGNKQNVLKFLEWIDDLFPVVIFCLVLLLVFKFFPDINIKLGEVSLSQTLIGLPLLIIIVISLYSIYENFKPFTKLSKILQGESIFYIGDQIEKYDKRQKIMNNITWVVIVGFLVSLIAGLIIALTTK
jgi:hypothetical protein